MVKHYLRERFASPKRFDPRSFRVKEVSPTTKLIVGCPKGKYCATCSKRRKCMVGLKVQAKLKKI